MMMQFKIHQAKTNLSKLIEAALAGEEVVIAKGDHPVVRLAPIRRKKFQFGIFAGSTGRSPSRFSGADERGRSEPLESEEVTSVLLDTHVWVWTLREPERLTKRAFNAIEDADEIYISSIAFSEISQKVRIGKWPDRASLLPNLLEIGERQGVTITKLDARTCLSAGMVDWDHRS